LTRADAPLVAVLVFTTEERTMTNLDHIAELRMELASCVLTRRERAQIERELKAALATQTEVERAHKTALEDLLGDATPA
jgi:Tfp pilus assembly protein PilF